MVIRSPKPVKTRPERGVHVRSSRGLECLTGLPSVVAEPPTIGRPHLHQDGGGRAEMETRGVGTMCRFQPRKGFRGWRAPSAGMSEDGVTAAVLVAQR